MIVRRFRTGDIVRSKDNNRLMTVIKYATKKAPVIGYYLSINELICGWSDPESGERKTAVFHENQLEKADQSGLLYTLGRLYEPKKRIYKN